MIEPETSWTNDPLDTTGEFSVRSDGWTRPQEVPRDGLVVVPTEAAMIRHRFPGPVGGVLVVLAPESQDLRIIAIRAGDRVVWHQRGGSCPCRREWMRVDPAIRDEYLVVEVEHDLESPVPLRVVLWTRDRENNDLCGVAVGYPPDDLGAKVFSETSSILLLPRR